MSEGLTAMMELFRRSHDTRNGNKNPGKHGSGKKGSGKKAPGRIKCLAALLGLLALPMLLPAQMVVPLSVEELSAVAEDIVHGTVVESTSDWHKGKLYTRNKVQVHESFKGEHQQGETMDVLTLGGSFGPLQSIAPTMPKLAEAEEVVVFVSKPATRRRAMGVEFNEDSPFMVTPQIIGGFQGKMRIIRKPVQQQQDRLRVSSEDIKITRDAPGRTTSAAEAPSYDQFAAQLRQILNQQATRRSTATLPTIGAVQVPEKRAEATALRFFDPLPAPNESRLPANAVLLRAPNSNTVETETTQNQQDTGDAQKPPATDKQQSHGSAHRGGIERITTVD